MRARIRVEPRLQEKEGKRDWRGAWARERGREKAWYIIRENAEKAGTKKVEVIENLFYQLN